MLKFKGLEEYLIDPNMKLISYDTVRTALRKNQKIEIVLQERKSLPVKHWEKLVDYSERSYAPQEYSLITAAEKQSGSSIWESDRNFRMKISRIDGMESIRFENFGVKPQSKPVKLFVSVSLYHIDTCIAEMKTEEYLYHGGTAPNWTDWMEGILCKVIPSGSVLHLVVWLNVGKKPIPLAWVNFNITSYRERIKQGWHSVKMFQSEPNVLAHAVENYEDRAAPKLSFEIEVLILPLYYPHISAKDDPPNFWNCVSPTTEEEKRLELIFNTDPLYIPTEMDKQLLWKHRAYCYSRPDSIAKLLWAVPWQHGSQEAYRMLSHWPLLSNPVNALEARWITAFLTC